MKDREFRLKALEIAKGDIALAEKYIAWAEASDTSDSDIDTYLSTDPVTPSLKNKFIEKYIIRGEKFPGERELHDLRYSDFLKTRYWKIISRYVKREAEGKCQICGASDNLQVHHKHYINHGDEARHLNDLICLCGKCHSRIHETPQLEPDLLIVDEDGKPIPAAKTN